MLKSFLRQNAQVQEEEFDQTLNELSQEWDTHHTQYEYSVAYGIRS